MRARLADIGEIIAGVILWYGSYVWGAILGAMFVCAPLLLAYLIGQIFDGLSATLAVAVGVVGAYLLDLPPWDADEPEAFLLVVGGAAVSAVALDFTRGSADLGTLLVGLAVTVAGWPVRRALTRRGRRWDADST